MAKVTGTVKWFSNRKGYGFVTPSNGGEDVFVHFSALQVKEGSFRGLHAEDEVEFTIEHDKEKGKDMAINVTYPNGALIDLPYRSREERQERASKRAEEGGNDKQDGEGNSGRKRAPRKRRPRKPRNDDDDDEAGADDPVSAVPIEREGDAIKGTVKWFSYRKGYGFVTRQDNNEDVFVHRRFLISPLAMPILVEEQEVEFTEGKDDGGRSIATQVTAPGNLPLPKKRRPRRPRNEDRDDNEGAAANNSEKKE